MKQKKTGANLSGKEMPYINLNSPQIKEQDSSIKLTYDEKTIFNLANKRHCYTAIYVQNVTRRFAE